MQQLKYLFFKKVISIIFSTDKPRSRPILQKSLPKNTTVPIGDNATMICIVLVSGTLPDFRWLKWDKSVTSTKKISDDLKNGSYRVIDPHSYKIIRVKDHLGCELTITNVKEDDLGLYTCYVSNHIGKDYSSAFFSKDEKPSDISSFPTTLVHFIFKTANITWRVIILNRITERLFLKK